jgi:hypothetical protein
MSKDNRRFSRIVLNVRARLVVSGEQYSIDQIANLSVGGCLLHIGKDLSLGSKCTLTILLARMEPGVDVSGEIVRSNEGEVGIKFTAVNPDSLFHLQNIIRYNAENPDIIEEEIVTCPGLK